ncbi:class I SAM-dependent methyltransferase [Marinifilum sp. JC120]|nr:class I SAM-dependent methyltransferase [Marinifilum sp. JC120]
MELTEAGIDWSEEWKRLYENSSIAMRRSSRPAYWNKCADRFSAMDNGALGRVRAIMEHIGLDSTRTVLDIGCGPGNLAVPLAKQSGSVTALDPAQSMLENLEQFALREGVNNITTIPKGWEQAVRDGDIVPHDLVLSSYSLIMEDMSEALAAMHETALDTVCIFWFAERECFGYDKFWPALFGEKYSAGPDHTILLNILNSMNIHPFVKIFPLQHVTRYSCLDDAVQCWEDSLYASGAKHREIIREKLLELLDTTTETPVMRREVQCAMTWWNKKKA